MDCIIEIESMQSQIFHGVWAHNSNKSTRQLRATCLPNLIPKMLITRVHPRRTLLLPSLATTRNLPAKRSKQSARRRILADVRCQTCRENLPKRRNLLMSNMLQQTRIQPGVWCKLQCVAWGMCLLMVYHVRVDPINPIMWIIGHTFLTYLLHTGIDCLPSIGIVKERELQACKSKVERVFALYFIYWTV